METLDIALPPPDLLVMGMRIRLEQVLINLLQNAFEAIGDKKADGRVEVRFEVTGEAVAVTVSDNGPGIAPEILQSLFTPFNTSKESGARPWPGHFKRHRGRLRRPDRGVQQ